MINRKIFLPLIGILLLVLLIPVSSGAVSVESPEEALTALLTRQWAAYQTELGIAEGGVALFLGTPGEYLFVTTGIGDNVNEQIHFRGASTTKTFTAASILLLHQQGLLNIDDTVIDLIPGTTEPYLPSTAEYRVPYQDRITIRHLLGHQAGVYDISNDPIPEDIEAPYAGLLYPEYIRYVTRDDYTFTFDELVGVVAQHDLSYFPPGEGFHYSNTGYAMLGKIIERVSGMTYGEFVETTFVKPLGLTSTSFPSQGDETTLPDPFAPGYSYYEGAVHQTTEDNMSQTVAEGNVITTPRDLAWWITHLLTGQAGLEPETVAMMTDITQTGEFHAWYGLGITYTEGLGYGHNGAHAGYMTIMRYDHDDAVTLVLFSSFLNGEDFLGQIEFMIELARQARNQAGY